MKKMIFLILFLSWTCAAQAQGKIQDGLLKMYKNNTIGNLLSSKKVQLNGVAFEYYDNGDIKRQSWYDQNHLQGPTKFFSKENKLVAVNVYKHDKLIDVQKYNDQGELIR